MGESGGSIMQAEDGGVHTSIAGLEVGNISREKGLLQRSRGDKAQLDRILHTGFQAASCLWLGCPTQGMGAE